MTKKLVVTTTPSTTPTAMASNPNSIRIFGPLNLALSQACAHVRNGYTLDNAYPVDIIGPNISFSLVLGNPSQDSVLAAQAALADALVLEEIDRAKEIEAAAQRLYEDRLRAESKAKLATEIAAQEQALSQLKQTLKAI